MGIADIPAGFLASPNTRIKPSESRDDRYYAALSDLRLAVNRLLVFLPVRSQTNFTLAANSGLTAAIS